MLEDRFDASGHALANSDMLLFVKARSAEGAGRCLAELSVFDAALAWLIGAILLGVEHQFRQLSANELITLMRLFRRF
jgi:hypothetical protein